MNRQRSPWRPAPRKPATTRTSLLPMIIVAALCGALGVIAFDRWEEVRRIAAAPGERIVQHVEPDHARSITFAMCIGGQGYNCVVDGDTFRMANEPMRIRNIDTPETYRNLCGGAREKALGKRAAERLLSILNSGLLSIDRHGTDRFGRTLVAVNVSGQDVGETLIEEQLARRWPDGSKWWCQG